MKIIHLKCDPIYFTEVVKGNKLFEIRFNDRNFKAGDIICLEEYKHKYTGNYIHLEVVYILKDFIGLADNYVALGLKQRFDLSVNLNATDM